MTKKEYRSYTESQLLGRKVRLVRPVANSYAVMSAGAVGTIDRKYTGLSLIFDKCETCGIQFRINRVQPHEVELLPLVEEGSQPCLT